MRGIQIAIDGPSGAGKSTMAKFVAKELGILYLDTGAMYRAVAWKAIRLGIDLDDPVGVARIAAETDISIAFREGAQHVLVDGEDVTGLIRTNEMSMGASKVSRFADVRARMVQIQQGIAAGNGVVMDGRDIGTHVLPDAQVKIFLTASPEDRARRRFLELQEKGLLDRTFEELLNEIATRDANDTNRAASPLRRAEDAVLLDTTGMEIGESVEQILKIVKTRA